MGVLDVLLYSKKGSGQKQLRAHAAINYKKREISIYFRVRLRHFLGRLLRLGQPRSRTPRLGKARGPNAAARGPTLSLYYNSLWHAHVTAFGSCHFFQTWKINKVHVEKNWYLLSAAQRFIQNTGLRPRTFLSLIYLFLYLLWKEIWNL